MNEAEAVGVVALPERPEGEAKGDGEVDAVSEGKVDSEEEGAVEAIFVFDRKQGRWKRW